MYPKHLSHFRKYKVQKLLMFKEWTYSLAKKKKKRERERETVCLVCVCVLFVHTLCVHPKSLGRGDFEIQQVIACPQYLCLRKAVL